MTSPEDSFVSDAGNTSGQSFEDWESIGEDFKSLDLTPFHIDIMKRMGYTQVAVISKRPEPDRHDNCIWKVRRLHERNGQRPDSRSREETAKYYACKVSMLQNYFRSKRTVGQAVQKLRNESSVLKRLNHPNIIRIIESIDLPDAETGFPYSFHCVIMELMDGDLGDFVEHWEGTERTSVKTMSEDEARVWFIQICEAISYLHGLGIAHMGIKPKNILYKQHKHSGETIFKLSDLEDYTTEEVVSRRIGRHQCTAPEVYKHKAGQQYSTKPTDIYSLGVCLIWSMSTMYYRNYKDALKWLVRNGSSNDFVDLYLKMSATVPAERPTIEQILENDWTNNVNVERRRSFSV